jgi:integrase
MTMMKLTARKLASLEPPTEGRLEVWDEDLPGFGLRLTASGRMTATVLYRRAGRLRRATLGTLPPLSLADARELARKALLDAATGADPAAAKAEERAAPGFTDLAALYLEKHAPQKRSAREDERIIKRELVPVWRTMLARDIRRADVIALLDSIASRPAPIMANRTLALVRKLFNFGIQRGLVESNPCMLLTPPGAENRRERVLSEAELRELWTALDAEPSIRLVAALRLGLLTAQRPGEVARMRWQDVVQERSGWCWTIPAEFAKNGRAHRVPLSALVVDLLGSLERGSSPWVLPGRRADSPLLETSVARYVAGLRRRLAMEHFTPHDLRRTAASHMTALGVARLVVKKLLNHVDMDVTAIYDRHSYDAEKRVALETWGQQVRQIVGPDGAVAVSAAAS